MERHAKNEPSNELKVRWKRYDENFKRRAVEHWLGSGLVAGELGVSASTLLTWKRQKALPLPAGQGQTPGQLLEENRRLRRENASLTRQREMFKKTHELQRQRLR